jgi:hypothetical protein
VLCMRCNKKQCQVQVHLNPECLVLLQPWLLRRAASVLQYLLDSNTTAKQRLLTIPIELPPSPASPPELLMPR